MVTTTETTVGQRVMAPAPSTLLVSALPLPLPGSPAPVGRPPLVSTKSHAQAAVPQQLAIPVHLTYHYTAESADRPLPTPLAPPLIRKKLGDIVKLSLKLSLLLERLMLSPHLSTRKLVKFADRLTNVRMFDGAESPQTVLTPVQLPLCEFDVDYIGAPAHYDQSFAPRKVRTDYFDWRNSSSDSDSDSEELARLARYEIDFTNMARPHQYYYQQVSSVSTSSAPAPKVYMHLLQISADNYLSGFIDVANVAYEKLLQIKLTVNNWRTNVLFLLSLPIISYNKPLDNGARDQFKFRFGLRDLGCTDAIVKMEMCCKFVTGNQVYWDNNNGHNYKVTLKRVGAASLAMTDAAKAAQRRVRDGLLETIRSYNYYDEDEAPALPSPRRKSEFSKYNFDGAPSQPFVPTARPVLKSSYSALDIFAMKPRYLKQYSKRLTVAGPSAGAAPETPAASESTPRTALNPLSSSLSYTDLLANFCFSNGSSASVSGQASPATPPKLPPTQLNLPTPFATSCSPLTASTLHALGDSIHI